MNALNEEIFETQYEDGFEGEDEYSDMEAGNYEGDFENDYEGGYEAGFGEGEGPLSEAAHELAQVADVAGILAGEDEVHHGRVHLGRLFAVALLQEVADQERDSSRRSRNGGSRQVQAAIRS